MLLDLEAKSEYTMVYVCVCLSLTALPLDSSLSSPRCDPQLSGCNGETLSLSDQAVLQRRAGRMSWGAH